MTPRITFAALAVAFFGFSATPAWAQAQPAKPNSADTYQLLNLFGDVFERVRSEYVEEVGDPELVESAIGGMLTSLDPHSSYLNAKSFRDMQVQTKGEFGGLGIEVTMDQGLVKVISPIDDTPASKAGLQPGDLISHIDGEAVQGLILDEAVERMRGPVGSAVKLGIRREGKDPFEVSLVRAVIKIQSVRARAEGDVGYLRITQFTEQTDGALKKHIEELRKEIGPKLTGWVLDLRNNPGGLLDQAVAVSDAFLEKGEVVSTRSRRAEDTQRFNARPGDLIAGKPLVILINEGSASASEIVAGALQDHKRATIIGVRSYGKGSVQTIIPLPGHGAMRLTTARYYTPSGRSIQQVGIEPDQLIYAVRQDPQQMARMAELRRGEAGLRNALSNPGGARGRENKTEIKPPPPGSEPPENAPEGYDHQLQKALAFLRSQAPEAKPAGK